MGAELRLDALHIHKRLVTRGARIGPKMPFCKHSIIIDSCISAYKLIELSNLAA